MAPRKLLNGLEPQPVNGHKLIGAGTGSENAADAADPLSHTKIREISSAASSDLSAESLRISAGPAAAIRLAIFGATESGPSLWEELAEKAKTDPGAEFEEDFKRNAAALREPDRERLIGSLKPRERGNRFRSAMTNYLPASDSIRAMQGTAVHLPGIDLWHEPVDGRELLHAISQYIPTYLKLSKPQIPVLIALWVLHAHCFDIFQHTPRLIITSPEKRCGKSTLLDLLEVLVPKPVNTANVSTAAVFRMIEKYGPTLLIDEADRFLDDKNDLIGILNAGHKRGGVVIRTVGEDFEPMQFSVFVVLVIAAIGKIADTLHDRGFEIRMKRAKADERPMPFGTEARKQGAALARKIARWVEDNRSALETVKPVMPDHFFNRRGDNYLPLFAIATVIGGDACQRLTSAEEAIRPDDEDEDEGRFPIMLLRSLKVIFDREPDPEHAILKTDHILQQLVVMEDMPWSSLPRGGQITPRYFWRMLKGYEIRPRQIYLRGEVLKGLKAADCADAFERYLARSAAKSIGSADKSEHASEQSPRKIEEVSGSAASAADLEAPPAPIFPAASAPIADFVRAGPKSSGDKELDAMRNKIHLARMKSRAARHQAEKIQ